MTWLILVSCDQAEFTVTNLTSFSLALHVGVVDISVDSDSYPDCLQLWIKASKTNHFHKGCFIRICTGSFPLCALQVVMAYLVVQGNSGGPLFLFQDGCLLSCSPRRLDQADFGTCQSSSELLQPQFSYRSGHSGSPLWHP